MAETSGGRRRLAAVWFADIVGYTTLSAENEDEALRAVAELQQIARERVQAHGGRIVKFIGDAVMTVFDSADAALQAALEVQERFGASASAGTRGVALRIGMHLGEVVEAPDGDVYGDGVNQAARVQGAADPGQVAVTESIQHVIRNRPQFVATPIGERSLKGLAEPVRLYAVSRTGAPGAPPRRRARGQLRARGRAFGVGIGAAVLSFISLSVFVAQRGAPEEAKASPDAAALRAATAPARGPASAQAASTPSTTGPGTTAGPPGSATASAPKSETPASPPSKPSPTGSWRVEEGRDPLTDAASASLSLTASRGPEATLALDCRGGRWNVRVRWPRPLADAGVRVRLDDGRDRDDRSQWGLLADSTGLVFRGDARRFLRDLLPARIWVAAAHPRNAEQEAAQFQLTGLERALDALRESCGAL